GALVIPKLMLIKFCCLKDRQQNLININFGMTNAPFMFFAIENNMNGALVIPKLMLIKFGMTNAPFMFFAIENNMNGALVIPN
ncbi:hypothetical protein PSY19_24160, partial [Shigella flexneri]|nr:hypothetical protein [Shigella flexneri]